MTLSKSRQLANHRWNEKNKDRVKYLRYRSYAKNFILKQAERADLQFLNDLIDEKKRAINES